MNPINFISKNSCTNFFKYAIYFLPKYFTSIFIKITIIEVLFNSIRNGQGHPQGQDAKRISEKSVHAGKFASQCRSKCGLHIIWNNTGVVRPYFEGEMVIYTPKYVSCSKRRLIWLIHCATSRKEAVSISDVVESAYNRMSTRGIS